MGLCPGALIRDIARIDIRPIDKGVFARMRLRSLPDLLSDIKSLDQL